MDDGSSHWTYTNNVLAYGAFGNWLGGNNQVRQNFLLRADLSGTDDITIDSPVCHWSMFVNPAYWQQHGSNNSFTNNTCLHWFGDIYAYGQYWAPGASSSSGGGGGGGSGGGSGGGGGSGAAGGNSSDATDTMAALVVAIAAAVTRAK